MYLQNTGTGPMWSELQTWEPGKDRGWERQMQVSHSCKASRFSPPRVSRTFPAGFLESLALGWVEPTGRAVVFAVTSNPALRLDTLCLSGTFPVAFNSLHQIPPRRRQSNLKENQLGIPLMISTPLSQHGAGSVLGESTRAIRLSSFGTKRPRPPCGRAGR